MMEEKKHLLDYLAQIIQIFGITILVITVICHFTGDEARDYSTMFVLGSKGIPINTILQFLLSSVCVTGIRFLFFSDKIFKKMAIAKRTMAMLISVIALTGIFAYLFGWFPVNQAICWISFFICFGICFIISAVVSYLKETMDNKQLEEALKRLKEEQNGSINRSK
jgi:hypothetical protein